MRRIYSTMDSSTQRAWHNVKKIVNIVMYLSAFLPMLTIMWAKEVILLAVQEVEAAQKAQPIRQFEWQAFLNVYLVVGIVIVFIITLFFCLLLRGNKKMATKIINVKKTKNQVAEYYLAYYSLFVLSLIGFSLTNIADIISLCLLMIILGIVYVKNGLYYMNPTVNIMRSFIYEVEYEEGGKMNSKVIISKEKIHDGDTISIYQSTYDFTLMEKKVVHNG